MLLYDVSNEKSMKNVRHWISSIEVVTMNTKPTCLTNANVPVYVWWQEAVKLFRPPSVD